jgi:hypothetical protein
MLARRSRVELIVIDELGYVPLAEVAAQLLLQIIAERPKTSLSSQPPICPSRDATGLHQLPALQGCARDRIGGRSPPENSAEEDEGVSPGCSVLLPPHPASYAPKETSIPNVNLLEGGPKQTAELGRIKLPTQLRPSH